jgi:UDP-glucose 4-epimerase
MAKVLVTGGAGFMGSWLADELLRRGHDVTNVDDLSGGFMRNVNKGCRFVKMDLRDAKKVDRVVGGQDIVCHLAAYAAEGQSVFSPREINDINITPMNNLLVSAVNHGVKKFIFTSSMAVYGSQKAPFDERMPALPEDPYGVGKLYCERMLQIFSDVYGFDYVILRPHNVYGPRQNISDPYRNVLGIWINSIMRGKPPYIYGDGKQTRAFSYIEDITPPMANAAEWDKANGHIINLGSHDATTVNDACKLVLKITGSEMKPEYLEERPCEVRHAHCTTEKSEKLLGYRTRHSLEQGLIKMVKWARDIGEQKPSYRIPLEITKRAPKVWREKMI